MGSLISNIMTIHPVARGERINSRPLVASVIIHLPNRRHQIILLLEDCLHALNIDACLIVVHMDPLRWDVHMDAAYPRDRGERVRDGALTVLA
jgi:hypothetical protein